MSPRVPLEGPEEKPRINPLFTYGFVKPHAYHRRDEIITYIQGFSGQRRRPLNVIYRKDDIITEEQARQHYLEHKDKPFYNEIVGMIRGPAHHFILSGHDAIRAFRDILGATNAAKAAPGTVRQKFGEPEKGIAYNAVHGSDGLESFVREVEIHFDRGDITEELGNLFWQYVAEYKDYLDSFKR